MGLTATATPQVREDICRALHINEEYTVMTGFERENLSFAVVKGQDRISYIDQYIRKMTKKQASFMPLRVKMLKSFTLDCKNQELTYQNTMLV